MTKSTKLILASQTVLMLMLAVCTVTMPQFLFSHSQGGIGNFALHRQTVIPFTLGFVGSATLLWQSARALPLDMYHYVGLRRSLQLIAVLGLLVLGTTYVYDRSDVLRSLHNILSQALIITEAILVYMYTFMWLRSFVTVLFAAIFLGGFTAGLLTLIGSLHGLFVAEITILGSFGVILVYVTHRLTRET